MRILLLLLCSVSCGAPLRNIVRIRCNDVVVYEIELVPGQEEALLLPQKVDCSITSTGER